MLKSSCSSCSQSQITAYVIDTETVLNFNDDSFTMFWEQQNQWNCHEHIVPSQNKDQEILQNYGDTLMFPILYMKYLGMNFSEVHEEINLRQDLYVDSCEDIKLRAGMICICFKRCGIAIYGQLNWICTLHHTLNLTFSNWACKLEYS